MPRLPPIVSFVAPSGTGKTTLIEGIIRSLSRRGLRIGVIKHDAHRLALDQPGKDSHRYRQAGAWRAVVASSEEIGCFGSLEGRPSLGELADRHLVDADLILTEGFRSSTVPAIRVHREAAEDPSWSPGSVDIIAWASDGHPNCRVPVLPLNSPEALADFLMRTFIGPSAPLPITGLIAALEDIGPESIHRCIAALREAGIERALCVRPEGAAPVPRVRTVCDLRPGMGPLGALFTGLAAAETPSVLLLSASSPPPPAEFLRGLNHWSPRSADVVVPVHNGRRMPLPGLYGHRCLSAIQASLLSGEGRLDGWWAQVRVYGIPEEVWRPSRPLA